MSRQLELDVPEEITIKILSADKDTQVDIETNPACQNEQMQKSPETHIPKAIKDNMGDKYDIFFANKVKAELPYSDITRFVSDSPIPNLKKQEQPSIYRPLVFSENNTPKEPARETKTEQPNLNLQLVESINENDIKEAIENSKILLDESEKAITDLERCDNCDNELTERKKS